MVEERFRSDFEIAIEQTFEELVAEMIDLDIDRGQSLFASQTAAV